MLVCFMCHAKKVRGKKVRKLAGKYNADDLWGLGKQMLASKGFKHFFLICRSSGLQDKEKQFFLNGVFPSNQYLFILNTSIKFK